MAFQDVKLPDNVERGAQGGPRFKTTILELSSGFEKRNIDWSRSRGEWDISYGIDNKADQEAVLAFFYARQGRASSFRFKDWTDFEIGDAVTDTSQTIATANGVLTQFQIIRLYSDGTFTFSRAITRPVSGIRVFINNTEQFSGFTVNNDNGVITFSVAPTNLDLVGVIGEYDNPVRFGSDELDLRAITFDAYSIQPIPVVEIREPLATLS